MEEPGFEPESSGWGPDVLTTELFPHTWCSYIVTEMRSVLLVFQRFTNTNKNPEVDNSENCKGVSTRTTYKTIFCRTTRRDDIRR